MFSLNTLFPTIESTYLLGKLYEGRHIVICSIFLIKGLREVIISGAPVFLSRFTICPIVRSPMWERRIIRWKRLIMIGEESTHTQVRSDFNEVMKTLIYLGKEMITMS